MRSDTAKIALTPAAMVTGAASKTPTTTVSDPTQSVGLAPLRIGIRVARLVVGGVFLVAGISKLLQPLAFLHAVYDYELLGPSSGLLVAAILPWVEILIGAAMILGVALPGASVLASLFLAVFVAAQGWAMYRDLAIDCGCFGFGGDGQVSVNSLLRTLMLFTMAVVILTASIRNFRL